jgi:hypothetical protein
MVAGSLALLFLLATFGTAAPIAAHGNSGLTCGSCHSAQAKPQPSTPMGQALQVTGGNPVLATHPRLEFATGGYQYVIETRNGQSTYSVSDGQRSISAPLYWAFGQKTQTFVLERDGQFFESLVSYYDQINGLDITIGDQVIQPHTLEEAFGRPTARTEITSCFGCHSTGSIRDDKLDLSHVQPGLSCQRCHTEASSHLAALTNPNVTLSEQRAAIPAHLGQRPAEETATFCGQCHRTWETVVRNNWFGPMNVRFQPYRLTMSKCFNGADARISCTACHNPHENLVTNTKAYDPKCLACHVTDKASGQNHVAALSEVTNPDKPGKACPVAQENCASCHMPKVDLPGGHKTFSDHNIRIARPGEAYPN